MAYTHSKYEVVMQGIVPAPSAGAPTSINFVNSIVQVTGTVAEWGPGLMPHFVRGVAYVQTAGQVNTAAVHMRFQHVKGNASTATNIATIVHPTTVTSLGRSVFYLVSGNVEILPGEGVRVAVTAAATVGVAGRYILYVEPRWELAANVTQMLQTTGLPENA